MDLDFRSTIDTVNFETVEQKDAARRFISQVYLYMFGALLITGTIAFQYGTDEFIETYFLQQTSKGLEIAPLFWVVSLSPIAVSFALQYLIDRASFVVIFALFVLYAVLLGFSLTVIFTIYVHSSIYAIFGVSAAVFAIMAILGYTTKADLTKLGSILGMAFTGIFIASLVNIWLGSSGMSWLISLIGAIIFPGLIAFHMQQIKVYARDSQASEEQKNKLALLGGFTLYILFVNLFLSLLRLFGERE